MLGEKLKPNSKMPAFAKRPVTLTNREQACLKGVIFGFTYKEIGVKLGINPKTVAAYLQRVREKGRCKTRFDMISFATKLGYFKDEVRVSHTSGATRSSRRQGAGIKKRPK